MGLPARYHGSLSAVTRGGGVDCQIIWAAAALGIKMRQAATENRRARRYIKPSEPDRNISRAVRLRRSPAPVARKPLIRIVESAGARVIARVGLSNAAPQIGKGCFRESLLPLIVGQRGVRKKPPDNAAPRRNVLEHRLH